VTAFQRPTSPDIEKIVEAWSIWMEGGPEVLPGRTMADLKIGGADLVLEAVGEDVDQLAPALQAWTAWEKGKVGPQETLDELVEVGFGDVVEALAKPA